MTKATAQAQTEGPFYTPETPERTSLREDGIDGTPLRVTGYVHSTGCHPVPGALLDFWHCDDAGVYDNEGYRLRGHQFADDEGEFTLETILPGLYTGRTRHIHVKVQAPNGPVLTTQLYFPDEPDNERDGIFDPALAWTSRMTRSRRAGRLLQLRPQGRLSGEVPIRRTAEGPRRNSSAARFGFVA